MLAMLFALLLTGCENSEVIKNITISELSEILKNDYNNKGIIKSVDLITKILENESKFTTHFNNALDNFDKLSKKEFGTKIEAISSALRKSNIEDSIKRFIHKNK